MEYTQHKEGLGQSSPARQTREIPRRGDLRREPQALYPGIPGNVLTYKRTSPFIRQLRATAIWSVYELPRRGKAEHILASPTLTGLW